MDEGQHSEKMHQTKTAQMKHSSSGPEILDSVESDTESLAQERAYKQQTQINISHHDRSRYKCLYQEREHSTDGDDTGYLHVYDSLEEEAHLRAKRGTSQRKRAGKDKGEGQSLLQSDDTCSDLRYDPNWSNNLRAAADFSRDPQTLMEDLKGPAENRGQTCADGAGLVIKGGYRYIPDTHPAVEVTSDECDQPYRLHPQDPHAPSVTSPHCYDQLLSHDSNLSSSSRSPTKSEEDYFRTGSRERCEDASAVSELAERKCDVFIQEVKSYNQRNMRNRPAGHTQTKKSFKLSLGKQERLTKDIVEENKVTLGRSIPRHSSYMMAHALKQDGPPQVGETLKETVDLESQDDRSDPDVSWLQKTQRLRITKEKKSQRKENPDPPQQELAPGPGVREKHRHSLSPALSRPANETQSKHLSPSLPVPPTIHFNISLNTSAHLLPVQPGGRDAVINLASLQGCPLWIPAPEELSLSPQYIQAKNTESLLMSQKGANVQLPVTYLERRPELWQRIPEELHQEELLRDLPGKPTTTSSPGSSVYTILPPIGKSQTDREVESNSGQSVNTAELVHGSSSDGYLVQMEKKKQKAGASYKAYSLKDYKQLGLDVNLRGLGPDYRAVEKTKLKRQRLYSNVIREQNKKISRIPFLPAKDPEGNDKKVPRMKALEYAKTIAKPALQPQSKQSQSGQSKGFTEHAQYLEGLDMFPLAALDVLRKRHEEEKQVVALFKNVHPV